MERNVVLAERAPVREQASPRSPQASTMALWWRAALTGLAFALFGLGSLALAAILMPLSRCVTADRGRAELLGQRVVHVGFRVLLWIAGALRLVRVIAVDTSRLLGPGPRLVVANHPTLIDVIALVACMPQVDCVVKGAHWQHPPMR